MSEPLEPKEIIRRHNSAWPPTGSGSLTPKYAAAAQHGYAGPDPFRSPDDEGGLIQYWHILRRRKGTVVLIALLGGVLGYLITLPQTRVYQSHVSIELQDVTQDVTNLTQTSREAQTYNALSDVLTQMKILQSQALAKRTITRLRKAKIEQAKLQPASGSGQGDTSQVSAGQRVDDPDDFRDPLNAAAKNVKVHSTSGTRIIDVMVDSPDRQLAATFANTLANEFIDQNVESRLKVNQLTGDWLGRQIDDMRTKLEGSEYALQAYAQETGLLFTGNSDSDKTNVSEDKLRQIQESLSTATADRVSKQSRYEVARGSPPEALPDVLNDSALRDYQSKLTDLKRQMAELSAIYTPDFSQIKRLQQQIQILESALERQRGAVIEKIKNEYDEAMGRENLLIAAYEKQAHAVTGEAQKTIRYNLLKREADSNRQLYQAMLQRVKESGIAAALKAPNIRIIDAATVPKFPVKPNALVDSALGVFLGTFLGFGFVVIRERTNRSIRDPGDAQSWLNVTELGVIPSLNKRERNVIPQHARSPMVAEAYRVVLTSVLFSRQNRRPPQLLVFTSPNPAEGKTTVVTNAAITLAEIGKKVLLIDADFSRPSVHGMFGIENDRGLTTLLQSSVIDNGLLQTCIQQLSDGAHVLPSGPPISDAANLLFASHMPDLLSKLRRQFDIILIDTPPIPQMPHARILGRMADGVIVIIRAGQTTRDAAMTAIQRLLEDGSRVLGTVLNDWNPKRSSSDYHGRYRKSASYMTRITRLPVATTQKARR